MELFIRIKDGQPFEHPILGDNFRAAFPNIDTNNLPSDFARFERISMPRISLYEVYEGVTYEWVDGWVKDVHHVRQMTAEEKLAKQNLAKEQWAQNSGPSSWVFNEETCSFNPPLPYPTDGLAYRWDEPTVSWVLVEV
jgi:hypothetical protein